ncbi:MAG: ArnT family glycosyltransferase [Bryobacteraceae bacterium]
MISALTNSGDSPHSSRPSAIAEAAVVIALLCALVCSSALWCFHRGYLLYYGDAQAHLNISRSIIDSRTPGYDQIGTVWLPLLHVICLPFVRNDSLWSSGLAGTIPVAVCFVVAGVCFYLAARDIYQSSIAASVVVACFAVNPNTLYLASIPMTEVVFLAGLAVMLLALFRFRRTQERRFVWLGIAAVWSMSLTRYDGWFLIPFASLGFALFSRNRRWLTLILFGLIASFAPLYWTAHNWWETGHALDFYNGPYSPIAIQGSKPYSGYHDWKLALLYYSAAAELCAGWPLLLLGCIGAACAAAKKVITPLLFLLLTPAFYVWSIHSSGATPIHVPQLWPFTYYNTRYGIAVVPLAAFAAGAIVLALPVRLRRYAFMVPLLSVAIWMLRPSPESWICWKESQVNSIARRAWTKASADFLFANYHRGDGALARFGDLTGIFCRARIPLAETLHEGNGPAWFAATSRPDLFHPEDWAIAQQGDSVFDAVNARTNAPYRMNHEIQVKDAPVIEIYKRSTEAGLSAGKGER